MTRRVIPRGDYTAPIFAAESYVGRTYVIVDDDGEYSAHPGDYWAARDDAPLGAIVKRSHPFRTSTGRLVRAPRLLTSSGTVGDLRRLARAAILDVEIRS